MSFYIYHPSLLFVGDDSEAYEGQFTLSFNDSLPHSAPNSLYEETHTSSADLSAEENDATGGTSDPGDILSTSASPALAAQAAASPPQSPKVVQQPRRLLPARDTSPTHSLPERNDEAVNEASVARAGQKRRREDDDEGADHVKRVHREPQVAVQAEIPGTTHPAPCADVLPPQPVPNAGPSQESAPPSGQPPEMSCTLPQGGSGPEICGFGGSAEDVWVHLKVVHGMSKYASTKGFQRNYEGNHKQALDKEAKESGDLGGAYQVECQLCPPNKRKYMRLDSLVRHVGDVHWHTGDDMRWCDACGKAKRKDTFGGTRHHLRKCVNKLVRTHKRLGHL
ncbi:uncharacterized protein B0H18DRAFT_960893 [Fomitopsis serialis]|uniref:uncharacterized protein n=1 Tax=Fomitopsis serialis TaxID=139415 RepID=UPI002008A023|nr:uncharacterized protein B0H18DRAFT_960893 [Neoantrodia serialis]KAH9912652.1 hypothetical protein B0H18DRAFT_960893 [Neoantrodia serialis]